MDNKTKAVRRIVRMLDRRAPKLPYDYPWPSVEFIDAIGARAMKTFEVVFYETKRYTKLVEAESEDEARSLCDDVETEELVEDMDFYDMEIVDVTEADWLEERE